MKYLNKTQGVITLYVNNILMTTRRFRTTQHRKNIMLEMTKSFEFISGLATVYFEVSHYECEHTTPEAAKEIKPESVKSKIRIYDNKKNEEPEPVKYERHKGVYSNPQYSH